MLVMCSLYGDCKCTGSVSMVIQYGAYITSNFFINSLTAKLFNFNFHPFEVVSRCSQLQVTKMIQT